jgi:hypothetical protein
MNHLLPILLSLILLPFRSLGGGGPTPFPTPTPIVFHSYPSSNISVNWGVINANNTIFIVANMLPGDTESRSITITNNSSSSRPLSLKGTKTSELKNFSRILTITVFKDNSSVYGPKLLSQFFTDSNSLAGISLGTQSGHSTSTYKFVVNFPSSAGNEYQQAKVIFNLEIGKKLEIPKKCQKIHCDGHDHDLKGDHNYVFAHFGDDDKIDEHDFRNCRVTGSDHH